LIDKSHRWQKTAVAAAAFALLGLVQPSAWALSLGRISVLSSLGEPLRAEIDIPDINAEEAASLRAEVASAAAFSAAGLEYNAAISGLQATLQRRADGRAYFRLIGEKSVNEPFVDMILEASWSSGRIMRDYTMLFDPPMAKLPQSIAPTLAQSAGATVSTPLTSVPPRAAPVQGKPAGGVAQTPATARLPAPAKIASVKIETGSTQQVIVKSGDTASKIAAQTLPSGVSLDQMLVAMMRTNPDAFINGNLNRIKTGAVMSIPSTELVQSVGPGEASHMVIAQSKDFNEFRRKLAANAPQAAVTPADRKTGGTIDAKVEEKKSAAPAPDKLTLSKGSIQGKADESKLAQERTEKDAAARATEISKNIADLARLNAASAPKTAPPAAAPALAASDAKVAASSSIPVSSLAVAPVAVASAASAPVATPVAAAPIAAISAPQKPIVEAPLAQEVPDLLDELLGDPMVPAAAGGLLALLGGFAFWRVRQRNKNSAHIDSSFLESRLQPDSFFGSSGGQRVDTSSDARGNTSSIAYTSSQLDAADDVDPVAEADVYLAYGRDLQAEEILKEALRHTPGRIAIHVKLLEIFAKRRDVGSFSAFAQQAFKVTGVDSADWVSICELGLSIDPQNGLYQPGAASLSGFNLPTETPSSREAGSGFGSTIALSANAELNSAPAGLDLDLDLDFSADDGPAVPAVAAPVQATTASNSIDFDISSPIELGHAELPLPEFDALGTVPMAGSSLADAASSEHGLIDFDMGDLSLDLDPPVDEIAMGSPSVFSEDPLETKLALAHEFVSIGDEDGARALIEEVLFEATGELHRKAQQALANLS
jgi:pilus assembly protein FimV